MTETDQPLPDDSMKHLDEMTCLLYIERQLDRARAQEVSAHTQECKTCRTLLRARHELRQALGQGGALAAGGTS